MDKTFKTISSQAAAGFQHNTDEKIYVLFRGIIDDV
jgi:hypothetical protein